LAGAYLKIGYCILLSLYLIIIITKKHDTFFSKTAKPITTKFSGIVEGSSLEVEFVSDFENYSPFVP